MAFSSCSPFWRDALFCFMMVLAGLLGLRELNEEAAAIAAVPLNCTIDSWKCSKAECCDWSTKPGLWMVWHGLTHLQTKLPDLEQQNARILVIDFFCCYHQTGRSGKVAKRAYAGIGRKDHVCWCVLIPLCLELHWARHSCQLPTYAHAHLFSTWAVLQAELVPRVCRLCFGQFLKRMLAITL